MTTKIPAELSSTPGIADSSNATAITIDSSENITLTGDISLADSKKVNIGAGNDLQIYHDGSNSFIKEAGTGSLYMPTSAVYMRNAADTAGVAYFVDGGAVTLYHSGTAKFATSSNGGIMYGGITFNGDTATANLLDDYEEGTWTPTLPNGGTVNNNYASIYTKIGRFVHAYCYVNVTATNNSSIFRIGGLPYSCASINNFYGGGSLGYTDTLDVSSWSAPLIHPLNNFLYFHFNTSSTGTVLNSHLGGVARYIMVNMTYKTDS